MRPADGQLSGFTRVMAGASCSSFVYSSTRSTALKAFSVSVDMRTTMLRPLVMVSAYDSDKPTNSPPLLLIICTPRPND